MRARRHGWILAAVGVTAAAVAFVPAATAAAAGAPATVTSPLVQQVGSDGLPAYSPVPGESTQHATELETDTYSWGSTVVAAYQVGRNYPTYGAQGIGFSTSVDNGATWTAGILPGLSASTPSPNPTYPTVVNQSVSYSAKFGQWLVPTVGYTAVTNSSGSTTLHETALLVNSSPDGLTWSPARTAVPVNVDKAWSTCDNTAASPQYGTCYVAYSQLNSAYDLAVVSSSDGGQTWSTPVNIPGTKSGTLTTGYNTNLVTRPDGSVVIAFTDVAKNGLNGSVLSSTISRDGGQTWSVPSTINTVKYHTPAGGYRALNKPSIDVDAAGTLYVAWSDCRFRTSCAHDDLVYASSANGTTWSAATRIPLDAVASTTDRFIPGFAVAPGGSGATAELSVVSYALLNGACGTSGKPACALDVQYATSYDGGATWTAPYTIDSTPMPAAWLANGNKGRLVGDYLSVSFCNGSAITVAAVASSAPNPGYHESQWALTLPPGWGTNPGGSVGNKPAQQRATVAVHEEVTATKRSVYHGA